jgi:hypothetical protein
MGIGDLEVLEGKNRVFWSFLGHFWVIFGPEGVKKVIFWVRGIKKVIFKARGLKKVIF